MNIEPKVNTVILSSIPIQKPVKNWILKKYAWLVKHNGVAYAAAVFSEMRVVSLGYRADTHRLDKVNEYVSAFPAKEKGMVRKVFKCLDTHPQHMLQLLKLYVGMNEPTVTVKMSAEAEDSYLESRPQHVNAAVPSFLSSWLKMVRSAKFTADEYSFLRSFGPYDKRTDYMCKYVKGHSYSEYLDYMDRWKRVTYVKSPTDDQIAKAIQSDEPLPEMYCDFDEKSSESESLLRDLWNLFNIELGGAQAGFGNDKPFLSPGSIDLVESYLHPGLMGLFDQWSNGENLPDLEKSFLDGCYVGNIHHIPKKGTVKRRPIAAPNRFLQLGMIPSYLVLEKLGNRLPKDATTDQSRFDKRVTNRVSNPNLYVGSVDLSQATDNLPLSWGEAIWDCLIKKWVTPEVQASWNLFLECSRAPWCNDGILSRWTVGQPLGCLPSFRVLSITHNLFLESLSFSLGYGHSPYTVLGDDVLIMSKKLRKEYIRQLKTRGIPLSLHKSFEGNLVEFAGKTYVKNHVPFYTSDQTPISYSSLFDYQRATGISIPWDHLPMQLQRRIERQVCHFGCKDKCLVPAIYQLVQCTAGLISSSDHFDSVAEDQMIQSFFYYDAILSEDREPDRNYKSGIVMINNHPITYLDYGYAEKHGYKQRFREIGLPDWYKQKFRPVTTDKLLNCATLAVKEVKGNV